MYEPCEPKVKTKRDWEKDNIARLCFTDETILTMVKFCSKWVQSLSSFSKLNPREYSLTLKDLMMRPDNKGAQKVINEGPR